jgi:hypothetical protein
MQTGYTNSPLRVLCTHNNLKFMWKLITAFILGSQFRISVMIFLLQQKWLVYTRDTDAREVAVYFR